MNKKLSVISLLVLATILTACSALSSGGSSAGLPQTLTHEWTIETGDIDEIFVAEDGNIYGFVYSKLPRRHITFTPDGELLDVIELPYDERMLDRYLMYGDNYSALPDGTIIIDLDWHIAFVNPDHTLEILPDPDSIPDTSIYRKDISENGDAWAYCFKTIYASAADIMSGSAEDKDFYIIYDVDKNRGFVQKKQIPLPNISDYSMYAGRGELSSLVYENTLEGNIIFYNRDGELVYDSLPDGLDISRRYFYYLTPWGDLWLEYQLYDAVGVDQGKVVLRIDQSGQETNFTTFPLENFESHKILYHANSDEVYYYGNSTFQILNRDFEVLESFIYPSNSAYGKFVGFDGNLYVWNKGELSKYSR